MAKRKKQGSLQEGSESTNQSQEQESFKEDQSSGERPTKSTETQEAPKPKVREISPEELEEMREKEEALQEKAPEPSPGDKSTVDLAQQDFCNSCGQQSMGGALQIRLPVPLPDGQTAVVDLPLLACARCGNAYMPRSFINRVLNPPEEKLVQLARPRISVPN